MNNTQIVSSDIDKIVSRVLLTLSEKLEKLDQGILTFSYGGRPVRAQKIDIVRIVAQTNFEKQEELAIRNIILEALVSAESAAAGAGFLLLSDILNKRSRFTDPRCRSEEKELHLVLKNFLGAGISTEILMSIVKNASINCDIELNVSRMAYSPVVRSMASMEMPGSTAEAFSTRKKEVRNSAVIFIDGVLESLGEIESLLQSASSNKKNIVVLARGFLPDVISTLSYNHNKRIMNVFPIKVVGDENLFEEARNFKFFFDSENYQSIRSLTTSDLDYDHVITLKERSVGISGIGDSKRKVYVTIPYHLKTLSGIIKDRILIGIKLAQEVCRYGVADCDSEFPVSIKSVRSSKLCKKSVLESLKNLGSLVLQEE